MSSFKISVQEYLQRAKAGSFDHIGFVEALRRELERINKKYFALREIADFQKGLDIEPDLFALPISVKDCICTKGIQSCSGSRILEGYIPPFDATSIRRAKDRGAIIIGKTNQDEFGFGTFSINSGYGIPKNPFDPTRVCGGSSGGSGCLTAALEMPHISLGESTGGSISAPAAFCSVVGLTPTYGLVSRYGLIDYASSLDKIGPLAKSVWDAALMLSVIAGRDEKDSTSLNVEPQDYTQYTTRADLKSVRIGIPKEYFNDLAPEVEKGVWTAIKKLESEGAKLVEISLPNTEFALAAYYIIATSEASTNLARFCGMRYGLHAELKGNFNQYFSEVRTEGFGKEAKRRIMLGTFARMAGYREAYYNKALKVRTLVINDFKRAFGKVDLLAAPTMPILPPKFEEVKKLTPIQNYQMDVLTVPANLAGLPHLSVPVKPATPIGLHLIGDHLQEPRLIEIGATYEAIR